MKKFIKYFIFLNLIILSITLISCKTKPKSLVDLVEFDNLTVTYDGNYHELVASYVPEGVDVTYTDNSFVDAGRYIVTATFSAKKYEDLELTRYLTINKASISNLSFESKTFSYDGISHTIEVSNVPEFINVSYKYYDQNNNLVNECINVGEYTVLASFTTTNLNYIAPSDLTTNMIITQTVEEKYTISDLTVTYDNKNHYITVNEEVKYPYTVSYKYYDSNNNEITECKNAGEYRVVAMFTSSNNNYKAPESISATLTINKSNSYNPTLNDKTYTYDNTAKNISVEEDLDGIYSVTYKYYDSNNNLVSECINAGTYTVVALFEVLNENYVELHSITATLTIKKATYDMSGVVFQNKSVSYDGEEKKIEIAGSLPSGVSVSYENNKLTNAGSVTATAIFTGDYLNYNLIENMTATLTIIEATIPNVVFNSKVFVYDGESHSIYLEDTLPSGVSVLYEGNGQINVGTYTIKAYLTDTDNNYEDMEIEATLSITKATYDMSGVSFTNKSAVYDGEEKEIEITGTLPSGVSVSYENNTLINAGSITATAIFTGDYSNYNLIENMTATLTIEKAEYNTSIYVENKTVAYDSTSQIIELLGTLPSGVSAEYTIISNNSVVIEAVIPGIYTFTYNFIGDYNNYYEIESISATLTITKADLALSLDDTNLVYSGEAQQVFVNGTLPSGVIANYKYVDENNNEYTSITDAGRYTLYVTFNFSNDYYNNLELECTVIIYYSINIDSNMDQTTYEYTYETYDLDELLDYLELTTPSLDGYIFDNWYFNVEDDDEDYLVEEYLEDILEIKDFVIFAKYIKTYVVTYDLKGNAKNAATADISSVEIVSGTKILVSYRPNIINNAYNEYGNYYTFIGWYTNSSYTSEFDFQNTIINSDITIYSKWDIIKIETKDEFISYISSSSSVNAYLSSNIDFNGETLERYSTNTSIIDSYGQFKIELNNDFYGNGFKIMNLNIDSDVELAGIWAKLNGGSISNVTFENINVISTKSRTGLIFGTITDGSSVKNVVFNNVFVNSGPQFGLIAGTAQANLNVDSVTVLNTTIKGGSNIAGLVGISSALLDIENVIIEADITSSGDNCSFIVASTSGETTIKNIVSTGSLTAKIAYGILSSYTDILISNILMINVQINATTYGLIMSGASSYDNIYYNNINILDNVIGTSVEYENIESLDLGEIDIVYNITNSFSLNNYTLEV